MKWNKAVLFLEGNNLISGLLDGAQNIFPYVFPQRKIWHQHGLPWLVNAGFFHQTHPRGRSGLPGCPHVAAAGLAEPPTAHTDLCCSLSLWTEQAWCWGQPGAANSLPWKVAKMPTPATTPGLTTEVCVSLCIMATAGAPSPVSAGRAEVLRLRPWPLLRTISSLRVQRCRGRRKTHEPNTCYFLSFSFWWVDSNIFMFIILIVVL